jgi:hypothetical protein
MFYQHDKRKRWRPQITIRELLLCTVVVALAVGWWLDRTKLQDQVDDARSRIQFLETSKFFDPPLSAF